MGVNSLPKSVTRQRRGCDLNPGTTACYHSATEPPSATKQYGLLPVKGR